MAFLFSLDFIYLTSEEYKQGEQQRGRRSLLSRKLDAGLDPQESGIMTQAVKVDP